MILNFSVKTSFKVFPGTRGNLAGSVREEGFEFEYLRFSNCLSELFIIPLDTNITKSPKKKMNSSSFILNHILFDNDRRVQMKQI